MCEFYVPFSTKWTWARSLDDFSLWILRISIEMITIIPISHSPHFSVKKKKLFVYFHQKLRYRVRRYEADADANLLRLSFQFASSKKENKNISVKWFWFTIVKWLLNKLLVRHFSWLKLFEIQPSTFEESCGVALVREFSRIVFLELDKTKAVFFCTPPLSKNWNRLADEKTVVSVGCHCAWQFSLTSVQMYIVYTF